MGAWLFEEIHNSPRRARPAARPGSGKTKGSPRRQRVQRRLQPRPAPAPAPVDGQVQRSFPRPSSTCHRGTRCQRRRRRRRLPGRRSAQRSRQALQRSARRRQHGACSARDRRAVPSSTRSRRDSSMCKFANTSTRQRTSRLHAGLFFGFRPPLARPRRPHADAKHAVCLTGLERSFEEIGANVREGVFSMLGPSVEFFGVHPVNSTWASITSLLPMRVLERSAAGAGARRAEQDRRVDALRLSTARRRLPPLVSAGALRHGAV